MYTAGGVAPSWRVSVMASAEKSAQSPIAEAEDSVRTRILRGAAEAFGQQGFGGTSVEVILASAGVSRRTFYRHFRSKEDVLCVLFENSVGMLLGAVREANRNRGSVAERRAAGVEAYIRIHASAGPLSRVLLHEQFVPGSALARQREAAMGAFTRLISRGIEREGRSVPDPLLVQGVVAGINQITTHMATQHPHGDWDVARAREAMLRLLGALDS